MSSFSFSSNKSLKRLSTFIRGIGSGFRSKALSVAPPLCDQIRLPHPIMNHERTTAEIAASLHRPPRPLAATAAAPPLSRPLGRSPY